MATHVSSFYANYGYNPRMDIKPRRVMKSEPARAFAEQMKNIHEEAGAALSKVHDNMQHYMDFNRSDTPNYKVGDKVWLSTKNLNINHSTRKLAEHQLGPFMIIKVISPNTMKLKLPTSFRIHDVINVSHLHPYKPPTPGPMVTPPESIKVEETPKYEVEEVLDFCLKWGALEYLVKWSGYTKDYDTWEPEANCANSRDLIEDFHKKNPSALRKLCANVFSGLVFKPYENLTEPNKTTLSHLEVEI